MKIKFGILTLLLIPQLVYAITEYQTGDTLFVIAKTGLNLREEPSLSGKTLRTIPYGEKIIAEEEKHPFWDQNSDSIKIIKAETWYKAPNNKTAPCWIKGKWVKIKYQDKFGYVFDGYLAHNRPLSINSHHNIESIVGYIERIHTRTDSTYLSYKFNTDYEKTVLKFNSGSRIEYGLTSKEGWLTLYLYDFSIEEILLYIKYQNENESRDDSVYLVNSDSKRGEYFFYGEISSIDIRVFNSMIVISFRHWC